MANKHTEEFKQEAVIPSLPVMDNLSSHKQASVRERIGAAGGTLRFLPPYSPDFNPIEKGVFQTRSNTAKGRRTNRQWLLDSDRQVRRYLPAARMRQLLQLMRI
jgi:transposase